MVCPFREGGAAVGSDYGWSQLNGVYAMLCSAMWAWYRLGHDVMRAKAARALKDVYGYELHLNGGGCPWRLPGVDMDRAKAMMAALGLDPARFDGNAVALARLLDGEPDDYARLSGRAAGGPDAGRSGVVEQFHNAGPPNHVRLGRDAGPAGDGPQPGGHDPVGGACGAGRAGGGVAGSGTAARPLP